MATRWCGGQSRGREPSLYVCAMVDTVGLARPTELCNTKGEGTLK